MPASDFTPTVDEVGARLGGRTLTETGARVGTFNDETFPTASMVRDLIKDGVAVVESAVGSELDQEYWSMAKTATIAYVCMSVEIGFYPETASHSDSAYASFKERFVQQVGYIETSLNQRRPNERRIVSLKQNTLVGWGDTGGRLDPFANELFP